MFVADLPQNVVVCPQRFRVISLRSHLNLLPIDRILSRGKTWAILRAACSRVPAAPSAPAADKEDDRLRAVPLSRELVPKPLCGGGVQARAHGDAFLGADKARLCGVHCAGAPGARRGAQCCPRPWDRLVVACFNARHRGCSGLRGTRGCHVGRSGARPPFPIWFRRDHSGIRRPRSIVHRRPDHSRSGGAR